MSRPPPGAGRPLRVAFFIQGEGRGHMTQALALKRILEEGGHEVVAAFMGENPQRPIPDFFRRRLDTPLHTCQAPSFALDRKKKGVRPGASLLRSLAQATGYRTFFTRLHRELMGYRPHLLTYILYPGYGEELEAWHRSHPQVELHCFWDRQDAPPEFSPRPGLTFHRLDDRKFLRYLAGCRGFTCTAGFESLCEAAFLGKPLQVVPAANHLEQLRNALDAERAGIAVWRRDFDLTDFLAGLEGGELRPPESFRERVLSAPGTFLRLLEAVALGHDPLRVPLPPPPSHAPEDRS